jgi:pimeloyl-ACP methyl ester carboxylesterase
MALSVCSPVAAIAAPLPGALTRDPPADTANPATMEVLHVESGGATIFAVVYLAAGAGPHPTLVIAHGWPGNEKNLDLAQAVRRAGWNAVTFNYRGSWGSGGQFRMANNPQDAAAVIAYLRAHAAKLRIDPAKIAMIGHSMGGWVTAMTGAADKSLIGLGLISAANMGMRGAIDRDALVALAKSNAETLDTPPEAVADELAANADRFDFLRGAPTLADRPLLVLTADDGLAPQANALVAAVRAAGGRRITTAHVATDHGWNDHRVDLTVRVLRWLDTLVPRERARR